MRREKGSDSASLRTNRADEASRWAIDSIAEETSQPHTTGASAVRALVECPVPHAISSAFFKVRGGRDEAISWTTCVWTRGRYTSYRRASSARSKYRIRALPPAGCPPSGSQHGAYHRVPPRGTLTGTADRLDYAVGPPPLAAQVQKSSRPRSSSNEIMTCSRYARRSARRSYQARTFGSSGAGIPISK